MRRVGGGGRGDGGGGGGERRGEQRGAYHLQQIHTSYSFLRKYLCVSKRYRIGIVLKNKPALSTIPLHTEKNYTDVFFKD